MKTAVLQYIVVQVFTASLLSEDLTVKTGHPEHGADKRRSSSECQSNSVRVIGVRKVVH